MIAVTRKTPPSLHLELASAIINLLQSDLEDASALFAALALIPGDPPPGILEGTLARHPNSVCSGIEALGCLGRRCQWDPSSELFEVLHSGWGTQSTEIMVAVADAVGDLSAVPGFEEFSGNFFVELLAAVRRGAVPLHWSGRLVSAMGDILRNLGEALIDYRQDMVDLLGELSVIPFDPESKGEVEVVASVFEGVLWLSGGVLRVWGGDSEFLRGCRRTLFALFAQRIVGIAGFHSRAMFHAVLQFCEDALENPAAVREYSMLVHHTSIQEYVKYLRTFGKKVETRKRAEHIGELLDSL
jgi:hypothetical protein